MPFSFTLSLYIYIYIYTALAHVINLTCSHVSRVLNSTLSTGTTFERAFSDSGAPQHDLRYIYIYIYMYKHVKNSLLYNDYHGMTCCCYAIIDIVPLCSLS